MAQHISTKSEGRNLGATGVEYFRAKLSYEMSPYGLNELLKDKANHTLHIIDVRAPEQYAQGHVPTAVNIPLQDLPGRLSEIPKDKTIVTCCGSLTCQLAPKAALELAQKGYKVMELHGGIKEWTGMGFPVEKA